MFTGIIEDIGTVKHLEKQLNNLHLTITSKISSELNIDQSVSHNGICLTVVDIKGDSYTVTAIEETLKKTNLSEIKLNDKVNLERAMKLSDRLDGHIVQGHVDQTATCIKIEETSGSWLFTFEYNKSLNNLTIEKGSITINGVSLTVINSSESTFSVAIIPYTFFHTNFNLISIKSTVNLEFDVIGKYVKKLFELNK